MSDELKEKALSVAKGYFGTDNIDVYCIPEHDAFLDAYEVGYAAALSDDGWTYCDDRLPDRPGVYFVTLHNGTIGQSAYYVGAFDKSVIAWWPRPTEPAKGRDV